MSIFNIQVYGAVGDGVTDSTRAIQEAIDMCEKAGGGTVYIPAGTYFTGPFALKSHMTLYVDTGATLSFTDDFERFPVVKTRWSGYVVHGFMPLIFAENAMNVSIKGGGTINGNGQAWWDVKNQLGKGNDYQSDKTSAIRESNKDFTEPGDTNLGEWPSQFLRPPLIQFFNVEKATISEVTLKNSPFWNTHLVFCNNVSIHQATFDNPHDAPNGDGLDIDSCQHVRVSDCHFSVGDDCVVLKSGINEDGRKYGVPTKNVTVTNCTMQYGHGGVVIGSENSGGVENITVSNCVFDGTDRGIRIKTNRERGSFIRNILVNNIMMDNVLCPIAINSFYRHGVSRSNPELLDANIIPVTEKTPVVEQIKISNMMARNTRAAASFIYGLPEMPIKKVSLEHITIEMTLDEEVPGGEPDMVREVIEMAGQGAFAKYVEDLSLHHVRILTRQGPALRLSQANNVLVGELTLDNQEEFGPVVEYDAVENFEIRGSQYNKLKSKYVLKVGDEFENI